MGQRVAHQVCEGQGVEGAAQEDRDAASEEGVRKVSSGLLAPRHDEAELRMRHVLQQLRPRLCLLCILLEVCIRARHLNTASFLQIGAHRPDQPAGEHTIKLCRTSWIAVQSSEESTCHVAN